MVVRGPAWQMGLGAPSRLGEREEDSLNPHSCPAPAAAQGEDHVKDRQLPSATFTEGPQATHIPAHAYLKSCLWSSQPPKSRAISRLKLHSELTSPFCPHSPKKGARWRSDTGPFLPSPGARGCTQHPFPAPCQQLFLLFPAQEPTVWTQTTGKWRWFS